MKKVRIVCLLLVLAFAVTSLSGCFLAGAKSVPSTIENGKFIYSIVRADESSQEVSNAAKTIRTAIKENMGATSAMVKDTVVAAEKGSCEILVGTTNRSESLETLKIVENNRTNNAFDFVVKVIDNKICIQATTDEMIVFACEWFANTFCQSMDTWNLLKTDYEFLYAPEVEAIKNTVAGVDFGRFTVVTPLNSTTFLPTLEISKIVSLYKNYGLTMSTTDDYDAPVKNELLLGNTSREESKSVTVEGDNYVIKVVGDKLVVKGGNDLSTWRAAKHLYDLIVASKDGEGINWTDGYVINGKYDAAEDGAYTLNFVDEFEGANVDLRTWGDYNYQHQRPGQSVLGGKVYSMDPKGQTTYEGQISGKMIYQADGYLTMATAKLPGDDFMSCDMSTFCSMLYKYGLIEIRAKMPEHPSSVSFWLNGTAEQNLRSRYGDITRSCFSEYDIFENYGSTTSFGSALHRWWTNYSADLQTTFSGHVSAMASDPRYHNDTNNADYRIDTERYGGDLSDDFHTYSLYWDPDGLRFAFDGKQYLECDFADQTGVSAHSTLDYLVLSNWMGKSGYGATYVPGQHPEYCELKIDYIRIYQTSAVRSQMVKNHSEYTPVVDGESIIVYPDNPIKGSY